MTEKIRADRALVRELGCKIELIIDDYDYETTLETLLELLGWVLSLVDCPDCRKVIGEELLRRLPQLIDTAEMTARERLQGDGPPHSAGHVH